MTTVVSVNEARKNLGNLMGEAFYTDRPFVLTRGKRAMAALVGIKVFRQMVRLMEKHDPGLADTLAIMSNPEIEALLKESEEDKKAGRVLPFTQA